MGIVARAASNRAVAAILLVASGCTAGLVLAASGAEIYLRATRNWEVCAHIEPGERENAVRAVSWASPDAGLGWVSARTRNDLNPQGFRDAHDFASVVPSPERTRIMVLGDSFMWGAGIDASETVSALLANALGPSWDVFNVSAPGWGIDQMYLAYLRFRDILRPNLVLLAFIDEDVERVLEAYRMAEGMNKPSFDLRSGELVLRTATDAEPRSLMDRTAVLRCAKREINRATKARAITAAIFHKLAKQTAGCGERLWILRIPHREAIDSPFGSLLWRLRTFEREFVAVDARYVELLAPVEQSGRTTRELYLADGHMSAMGTAALAASLVPALREAINPR